MIALHWLKHVLDGQLLLYLRNKLLDTEHQRTKNKKMDVSYRSVHLIPCSILHIIYPLIKCRPNHFLNLQELKYLFCNYPFINDRTRLTVSKARNNTVRSSHEDSAHAIQSKLECKQQFKEKGIKNRRTFDQGIDRHCLLIHHAKQRFVKKIDRHFL